MIVWLAIAAISVDRAVHRLQSGVAAADRARHELNAADLAADRPRVDLDQAAASFRAAHHELSSGWLAPIGIVPVAGRQLHSAQDLSAAASTVTGAGLTTLAQVHGLITAPHTTASQRATLIGHLATTVAALSHTVHGVDLGPAHGLLSVLAAKRATFAGDLTKLQSTLTRAQGATAAAANLLQGPGTYLVLAANNAEMRDGSGMFLEAGVIRSDNGQIAPGPFVPTDQLYDPSTTVPLTGTLGRLWGSLHPNQEWRNLALTPQFPANAALAAQMWQAQTGQRVDGVLAIDVGGLRDLLAATGPVGAGGTTVDTGDVEADLLMAQYDGLGLAEQQNDARHEALGLLAGAVLGALEQPGISTATLAQQFAAAASGRHVLAWSARPAIEADWAAAGASGQVEGNDVLLGLSNRGNDKLDPYQDVTASLSTTPHGADTLVTIRATVVNHVPAAVISGSPYAAGGAVAPPGTYVGLATLDFPLAAGRATVDRGVTAAGVDGTSKELSVLVTVAPGQTTTVTWQFFLAGLSGSLAIQPSARIGPTTWGAQGRTFTDAQARTVVW